ncbi:hypothetical protein [Jeotgalibacillus sp. R-1-5s-1]|uniref:hypothetical protein n=1 Tax=Jeotgalibacillus sp. R-1-5s-1 TaxID=2555897 RepID=UPI00106BB41F|nr:hypothetical protein [Jeotgalibacillus sp. R-1-5s-1]TFD97032.1 hypothetical protein E2491_10065 [Jeotgalibacillus sp. R-1-5s-1]
MQLDPIGKMLFMEICKKLRDQKWTVDDHRFYDDKDITEAVFLLPDHFVETEDNPELEKVIASVSYAGEIDKMKENHIDGVHVTFYAKRLKALDLTKAIGSVTPFQQKKNATTIEYFIDQPFADEKVQKWIEELFSVLENKMTELYGDEIKQIPIVLLPARLQDLPIHHT